MTPQQRAFLAQIAAAKAEAQKLRALDPNATKVAVLRWPSLKG